MDTENTVYTALRPIELLSKIFGFCPQTHLRTKQRFTVAGTIHVIIILVMKVFLIYYNLYPSKFSKATNSPILNSGLWIQTEASLAISILYILLGINKCSEKWTLMESFHDIDQEFMKSFYVKYHYVQVKHWISFFVIFGVVVHFILIIITAYYLWNLPFEPWHRWSICIAIYFSNISIFSIANQFLCGQLYLLSRFNNINDILSQLMFEESIRNGLLLIESKTADCNDAFVESMECKTQRRPVIQNAFERSGCDIGFETVNGFQIKYSFEKEFPRRITNANAFASPKLVHKYKQTKVLSFFQVVLKTCVKQLSFTTLSTAPEILRKLDKIMELHDRLSDCVDQSNYFLALEVLLISLTICVYLVFGLFAKYRVWMDYQYEADSLAQMNIYWIVVYSFSILVATSVTSSVMQTAKETAIITHKVACRNKNFVVLNKLSQMSQMFYSRKTTVGCGLIVFNWPTVFTLLGAVWMYLIILIQFYISGRPNTTQPVNYSNYTNIV